MDFIFQGIVDGLGLIIRFDSEVYLIIWVSLKVSLIAVMSAAMIGIPIGVLIALKDFWLKRALTVALNTAMAFPTVVLGLMFYAFLSRKGPLGDYGLLFTPYGMELGLFFLATPLVINLTLSAVQALDPRLFLTCRTLGANAWQEFCMILREGRFAITAAVAFAFGRVISEVGIAMMLGGNIKGFTRTMTTAIALETSKGEFELGMALGMALLFVALLVNLALYALQRQSR
ncbi:MAG: ABC transporter permease [Syntrophaceae bacterium]|nr:ABC transporter permease [Syntrophaceae bacterium]